MKTPLRHLRWVVAVLLAAGLGSACAGPQNGAAAGGGTLNIFLYQKPKLFSPLAPAHGPDQQVMSLIYQGLMTTDPELKLVPQLAEKVDVSADATTFTFTLPKGLKWSDGQPFSSADVLFTHQLLANPKSTSVSAGAYRDIKGVKEVVDGKAASASGLSAPDESTFVVTTTAPNFGILAQVATAPILPKHVLGDKPIEKVASDPFFTKPVVGMGPFQFVSYQTDQYVQLHANPHYRTDVGIDTIYLKPVTADVATAQLGTGELDIAAISPTERATLGRYDQLGFATAKDGGFVRIALNLTQDRFADERVRQAMLYGIDRKAIVDSALPGVGKPRNSSFDPAASGDGIEPYTYDKQKAKALLNAAGWDSAKPVTLSWIAGSNPDRDAAATAIQSQLAEVGVQVKLQQVDAGWNNAAFKNMSFDMYLFGGGNYAADSWNVNGIVGCDTHFPKGGNLVRFCDQELDQKMKQANGTTDAQARLALYTEAARIDNRKVPYLWLYSPGGLWAVNKRVQNFHPLYPTGGPFWKAEDWRITSG